MYFGLNSLLMWIEFDRFVTFLKGCGITDFSKEIISSWNYQPMMIEVDSLLSWAQDKGLIIANKKKGYLTPTYKTSEYTNKRFRRNPLKATSKSPAFSIFPIEDLIQMPDISDTSTESSLAKLIAKIRKDAPNYLRVLKWLQKEDCILWNFETGRVKPSNITLSRKQSLEIMWSLADLSVISPIYTFPNKNTIWQVIQGRAFEIARNLKNPASPVVGYKIAEPLLCDILYYLFNGVNFADLYANETSGIKVEKITPISPKEYQYMMCLFSEKRIVKPSDVPFCAVEDHARELLEDLKKTGFLKPTQRKWEFTPNRQKILQILDVVSTPTKIPQLFGGRIIITDRDTRPFQTALSF